jgi:hypothetical protein
MALLLCPARSVAEDFKPVSPEELQLKEVSGAPGAHAVILEYTSNQNDTDSWEDEYYRIKVFDEEGKKHGDIELAYLRGVTNIGSIKARVLQPNGQIQPFDGKIFEKTVVKGRGFKFQAKAFSLPNVQPGSIIEYKFRRSWDASRLVNTRWTLQRDLFMKKASYVLQTYTGPGVGSYWMALGLPAGKQVQRKGDKIMLTLEDMPAFDEESYAPPEDQLKPRVEFFYSSRDVEKPDKFWPRVGKESYEEIESFIGNRKAIAQALNEFVTPAADPETKLKTIYTRVQQMRNLSWEREKTEQEAKRDKLKDSNNVEDVWKRGYGYRVELNRLFIAFARAAGFQAVPIMASRRDDVFFDRNLTDARQLNSEIVYVNAAGKEYYLEPGVPHCRFGTLRWMNTGVVGLKLNKDGGEFIQTPQPDITTGVTKRLVNLHYEDGLFKGKVSLLFDGLEALDRRLDLLEEDEKEYNDDLEDEVKKLLPDNSTVKLVKIENAHGTEEPLIVHFDVELPDFSSQVGSRRLVPLAILQQGNANPFRHEKRTYPVYYSYPFQEVDFVTLELPDGYEVETLPAARKIDPPYAYYGTKWEKDAKQVAFTRQFAIRGYFFRLEHYPSLRDFYSQAATGDEDSVVLKTKARGAK